MPGIVVLPGGAGEFGEEELPEGGAEEEETGEGQKDFDTGVEDLVDARAREGPANPHLDENQEQALGDEDDESDEIKEQEKKVIVRGGVVADEAEGIVPGAEEEGDLDGGDDEHGAVFGEEEEREANAGVFSVIAGDEFGFGFGEVERGAFVGGEGGDEEDGGGGESEGVAEAEPSVETPLLEVGDGQEVECASGHDGDEDGEAERDFVGDHLAGFADGAVDGPFIVGSPASEDDAEDFDGEDGENPEQAGGEMGLEDEIGGEGDGEKTDEDGDEGKVRGEAEEEVVGAGGDEIFLEGEFEPVGGGLEQPNRTDTIGAVAGLHAGGDFAFPPDAKHGDGGGEESSKEDGDNEEGVEEGMGGWAVEEEALKEGGWGHKQRAVVAKGVGKGQGRIRASTFWAQERSCLERPWMSWVE